MYEDPVLGCRHSIDRAVAAHVDTVAAMVNARTDAAISVELPI